MPPRDWKVRIEDILEGISKVERYTSGMTYETFLKDDKTIDAVCRILGVMGEAATHIPEEIQAKHSNVPWAEVRGMRNVLVHQYFDVNESILWDTIRRDLPELKKLLEKLT